jgi:hypothetical protein
MKDIIQATLILDHCALHWQVELSPEDTRTYAEQCLSYNGSTHENVTSLVQMVDEAVPLIDFGGTNPNNGKPCHHYAVGCEGSRVIYLRVHKRLVHDLDYRALERKLDHIARQCGVDEFWMVANTGAEFIYRFWWD